MIRLATKQDIKIILNIYEYARNYMRENGNKTQWDNNYPEKELLIEDIEKNNYMYMKKKIKYMVFLHL